MIREGATMIVEWRVKKTVEKRREEKTRLLHSYIHRIYNSEK